MTDDPGGAGDPCDTVAALADDAIALADASPTRAVLGISGSPGAGKSTLVDLLLTALRRRRGDGWAAHIPMDGFHLADAQLRRLGLLDRKGAPETFDAAGYAHLLARVRAGPDAVDPDGVDPDGDIYAPGFDRTLEQPLAAALVVPASARLVVTEGNYLLLDEPRWRPARAAMDRVWFVAADEQQRLDRLVQRHVEFGKSPQAAKSWVDSVDEPNAVLVTSTAGRADRVVVNGAHGWAFSS